MGEATADRRAAGTPPAFVGSFSACKEQQLVFLLVRQLAHAQFALADRAMTQRLWQEVEALEIDPERIIRLLYGGHDVHDREALQVLDAQWRACQSPRRRGWFSRPVPPAAAGRRSAPPAAPRAHQPAR
jgi:hypothetical protein